MLIELRVGSVSPIRTAVRTPTVLATTFWSIPDALFPYNSIFPPIPEQKLAGCLRDAYDARSSYVHAGNPFPPTLSLERGIERPPFSWLERLTQMVIVEYLHRSCAPQLLSARQAEQVEKERLLMAMKELPENVMTALGKLTKWTARFLGTSVINPMAPNRKWADKVSTVSLLREKGLIGGEGNGMKGQSWLKDRFVGEVVGEHIFGVAKNPFRENELLLPKGLND